MRNNRLLLMGGVLVVAIAVAIAAAMPRAQSSPQDRPAPAMPRGPGWEASELARADLSARLGVSAERISEDSVRDETWSDTSLGLPQPGMMYAQVITHGFVVTLRHNGQTYVYHVAGEALKLRP